MWGEVKVSAKPPLPEAVLLQMRQVDQLIRETLHTTTRPLQDMIDHLLQGGGKKIRPLLVLLAGALFSGREDDSMYDALLKTAASVEMIHTASLVHDDIIDGAVRRRGHATLHNRWDAGSAVLVGDYLLSRAFHLLCSLEQRGALLPLMARTVTLLCRGEARQLDKAYEWGISEQEYFLCNYLKTSQLLAACCEAGGRIASAATPQIRALCEYGFNLGQAFQVVDDILDFTDNPAALGKPVGADLNQGVVTLPLIFLINKKKRYRAILEALKKRGGPVPYKFTDQINRAVRDCGALNYAAGKAEKAKGQALRALEALPQGPPRDILARIADSLTARMADACMARAR